MHDLTHASFFSGVGGTDLGLERAGWRTVSFSEIDPYACAVLAERWPDVVNLGDIVQLANSRELREGMERSATAWKSSTLWSGGFPCQDLSVAGKRAGFTGERSVLAFAFLALVERYRPPAILLENVPGLLSSHGGRDMAALVGRMVELGYGVAYRVLDAQHFGVPQRRRRVFILGLRCDPDDADGRIAAERAAEVLSVGTRCGRHPATGHEKGQGTADGATASLDDIGAQHPALTRSGPGVGFSNKDDGVLAVSAAVTAQWGHRGGPAGDESYNLTVVSTPPDADRMRAPDGLAGRAHDSGGVERPWVTSGPEMIDASGYHRETLSYDVTPTLNGYTTPMLGATLNSGGNNGGFRIEPGEHLTFGAAVADDPLLPLGLDSHRYRCCGNGVVAPVAEWLGLRLAEALR